MRVPVLTVRNPWAWHIIHGAKNIENRTWRTRHRGPLAIHVGLKPATTVPARAVADAVPDDAPRGVIIGLVDLVDIVNDADSPWAFVDHWHWMLRDPRPLATPIPFTGSLSMPLIDIPDDALPAADKAESQRS